MQGGHVVFMDWHRSIPALTFTTCHLSAPIKLPQIMRDQGPSQPMRAYRKHLELSRVTNVSASIRTTFLFPPLRLERPLGLPMPPSTLSATLPLQIIQPPFLLKPVTGKILNLKRYR